MCGNAFLCTFNYDTLISSGIAIVLTLALGLGVAYRLGHGKPGKLQMVLELLLGYIRNLTQGDGRRMTRGSSRRSRRPSSSSSCSPTGSTSSRSTKPVEPAAADINLTIAMAIAVIVIVQWYSIHVLGFRGYLRRFTKPFELPLIGRIAFTPLNIIEEVAKPLSLALRSLRQHLRRPGHGVPAHPRLHVAFAGSSVVQTALTPIWVILLVVWKLFDVFLIGTIQAFIFMLLTIIYFGMAREGLEEEGHHGAASHRNELRRETT